MGNRFVTRAALTILISLALALYRVDTVQRLVMAEVCAQTLPAPSSGGFELDVDHIAQTITRQEMAVYYIEVVDSLDRPISLSVANPNDNLSYELQPKTISKTSLVKLSVTAREVGNEIDQHLIVVKAQMASETGEVVRCIRMWLFVLASPPSETTVTLAVRPNVPLVNGVLQPIEGRVLPVPMQGNVLLILHAPAPDRVQQEISLPVDRLGRFGHNHVFRKPGEWRAEVVGIGLNSLHSEKQRTRATANFRGFDAISFDVAKRIPRIAVTAIDSRKKRIGEQLEIVGQLVADTINVPVRIKVVSPRKDTTTLDAFVESKLGQFRTFYTIADTGFHTIIASAPQLRIQLPPSCGQAFEGIKAQVQQRFGAGREGGMMTAMAGPNTGGEEAAAPILTTFAAPPDCQAQDVAIAPVGNSTTDYAIIIVGGADGSNPPSLDKQNSMAAFLYGRLKRRGFTDQHILLLSQSQCVAGNLTRDGSSFDFDDTSAAGPIPGFFSQIANKAGKNLLVYFIGTVTTTGGEKYVVYHDTDPAQKKEKTPSQLAIFLHQSVFAGFGKIICMVDFEYGEKFLLALAPSATPQMINISSTRMTTPVAGNLSNDPAASFVGKLAIRISQSVPLSLGAGFYDIHQEFNATFEPWLDDNGTNQRPNGAFEQAVNPQQVQATEDGFNSKDDYVGVDTGSSQVPPAANGNGNGNGSGNGNCSNNGQATLEHNPIGPGTSPHARLVVALDNPNNFPIESMTANIFPPRKSRFSVMEVPMAFDSASGAFKSERICFPDSELYRFEINYKYHGPSGENFHAFAFDKARYVVAAPQPPPSTPAVFFDPRVEAGFNYGRGFDPGSVRESQNKPGGVIDVNFFSTQGGNLEFLGLGVASNFDRVWGMLMPISVSAGGTKVLSNLWIYGGFGYELGNAKLIQEDLLYFVGLKYRLFSLKH